MNIRRFGKLSTNGERYPTGLQHWLCIALAFDLSNH